MNLLRLLGKLAIFACVGFVALAVVGKVRQQSGGSSSNVADATASPAGFVPLPYIGAENPRVVILTPANCPSAEAKRARALADSLAKAGIPNDMKSNVSFALTDQGTADRTNKFMSTARVPIVLIRGRAKSDATFDQVVAEYRAAR